MVNVKNHVLDSLLAECDEQFVRLELTAPGTGVRSVPGDNSRPLSSVLLDELRPHKAAVIAILKAAPRPAPDPVVFVARNLSTLALPARLAPPVVFFEGDRPFYRLTPRVLFWLENAVQSVWDSSDKDDATRAKLEAMAAVLWGLSRWVDRYYRPDQIRRGRKLAVTLPTIRKPVDS